MFKAKKSRLGQSIETFESIIGASLRVEGDLIISKSLRVDGVVNGNIYQAEGEAATVAIAPKAVVTGDVKVQDVIVSGTLKGHVISAGRVELIDTAKVEGDVTYGSIGIAVGARIVGKLTQIELQAESTAADVISKVAKQESVSEKATDKAVEKTLNEKPQNLDKPKVAFDKVQDKSAKPESTKPEMKFDNKVFD